MNTNKLIQFFTTKLNIIPELRRLDAENPIFSTWWNTIISTCERMGESYATRAERIDFYPSVVFGNGDRTQYSRAYQHGLNDAEAFIKSLIEELETWGFNDQPNIKTSANSPLNDENNVILNLTISQQQIQQITQTINSSQYGAEVQEKIQELLSELKKETKNKTKIIETVKWLADKSSDALIAILLASTHLT